MNVCAVVEIQKDPKQGIFVEDDVEFSKFFVKKFRHYAKWLLEPKHPSELTTEMIELMEVEQFLVLFSASNSIIFQLSSMRNLALRRHIQSTDSIHWRYYHS